MVLNVGTIKSCSRMHPVALLARDHFAVALHRRRRRRRRRAWRRGWRLDAAQRELAELAAVITCCPPFLVLQEGHMRKGRSMELECLAVYL